MLRRYPREHDPSEDPDEAADLLLENGFVLLPRCVVGAELAEMRAAYERVAEGCRAGWRASWDAGTERVDVGANWTFPLLASRSADDDGRNIHWPAAELWPTVEFYPLLDPPLLLQTAHRVLGRPPTLSGTGGVVIPPADDVPHSEDGYLSWHRDHGVGWAGENWPYPKSRDLKCSIYLYDVPDDGGCLVSPPSPTTLCCISDSFYATRRSCPAAIACRTHRSKRCSAASVGVEATITSRNRRPARSTCRPATNPTAARRGLRRRTTWRHRRCPTACGPPCPRAGRSSLTRCRECKH